jgi:hypothetical protein
LSLWFEISASGPIFYRYICQIFCFEFFYIQPKKKKAA